MAAPDAPVLISATPYGSQVRLKYTRPAGTVSFKVYRDAVEQAAGVTTDFKLVTVVPGTLYAFTVKATNGDGDSAASNTIQAAGPLLPLAQTESDIDVAAHEAASNPHPTYETSAEAQAKVDAHSSDTTDVHGIADTSVVGIVQRATVNLTNAQVLALVTTPVEIVAAPGANKAIVVLMAHLRCAAAVDYGNIDAAADITLRTGTDAKITWLESLSGSVSGILAPGDPADAQNGFASFVQRLGPQPNPTQTRGLAGVYDSDIEGLALRLVATNGSAGDFNGGDAANVLRVTVYYLVVDL